MSASSKNLIRSTFINKQFNNGMAGDPSGHTV